MARPRPRAGPAIFAPPLPRAAPAAARSPCARGLPRAIAAPVLSPGVVRHVPDEQRRIGGAQVAGHGGDTNGLSKPSAAPPAAPSHSHSRPEPEGSATATATSRETSLPPPLPPPPPHLPPRSGSGSTGADQRLLHARSRGLGARATAAVLVIGSRRRSLPSPQPVLSFFSASFSRPFLPCHSGFPHLVLAGECFQLPWLGI